MYFKELFPEALPIIGMIHLPSIPGKGMFTNALEELAIYEQEGLSGAIIENYHGEVEDVIQIIDHLSTHPSKLKIGINILPNEFDQSFGLAHDYGCSFIQLEFLFLEESGQNIILPS